MQNAINTSTPEGKLLLNLLAAIAEYERTILLERTKAGRELAEKQGKICHRPRKAIDPRILAEMKREGISLTTCLKRLNKLGCANLRL